MALPANLVCNVPAAQSREGWVDIDSGSDAVSRTPFLPWQPMAAAGAAAQQRSRITTLQFARAFGTRCSISRVPADLAAAQGASVVRVRFNGPFWTRVLTELAASGFFVAGLFANLREMLEALTRLALQNPQQLLITAADWSLGQDFVIPAGAGGAAAARRQLLLPTRFISLVTADMLELSPPSPTPLKVLFDLLGFLGPCLTQASREQEVSTFQAAARKLRAAVDSGNSVDGTLATDLFGYLEGQLEAFPDQLRSVALDETSLRSELTDILDFTRSALHKTNTEQKRVKLLGYRSAGTPTPRPPAVASPRASPPRIRRARESANAVRRGRRTGGRSCASLGLGWPSHAAQPSTS